MRNLIDQRVGQKLASIYGVLNTLTAFATGKSGSTIRVATVLAAECALLTLLYSRKLLTRTLTEKTLLEVRYIELIPTLEEQLAEREQQKIRRYHSAPRCEKCCLCTFRSRVSRTA